MNTLQVAIDMQGTEVFQGPLLEQEEKTPCEVNSTFQ